MSNLSYKLVAYTLRDYEFVYQLKKTSYKQYVEHFFGCWAEDQQRAMFDEFLSTTAEYIQIIIVNNKLAGFIDGHDISASLYQQGNICLLPEFRGKGLGTIILRDIISQHLNQDIQLKVFKTNPAKNLYERLGFCIIDETASHFIMVKKHK